MPSWVSVSSLCVSWTSPECQLLVDCPVTRSPLPTTLCVLIPTLCWAQQTLAHFWHRCCCSTGGFPSCPCVCVRPTACLTSPCFSSYCNKTLAHFWHRCCCSTGYGPLHEHRLSTASPPSPCASRQVYHCKAGVTGCSTPLVSSRLEAYSSGYKRFCAAATPAPPPFDPCPAPWLSPPPSSPASPA